MERAVGEEEEEEEAAAVEEEGEAAAGAKAAHPWGEEMARRRAAAAETSAGKVFMVGAFYFCGKGAGCGGVGGFGGAWDAAVPIRVLGGCGVWGVKGTLPPRKEEGKKEVGVGGEEGGEEFLSITRRRAGRHGDGE
jgi:hypothetical protein